MSLIPSLSKRIKTKENYLKLARLLGEDSPSKVLVVGSGDAGGEIDSLISNCSFELVKTDVTFGPRTVLIRDAHDIPFDDETFNAVIAQAVLEHVVDPYRCVEEIRRVLKKHGLVYAETPFMAQVHFGRYDFTRFTYLGHRRLFRRFNEIESGASSGPGMALAWSYRYFLMSFTSSPSLRALLWAFSGFTSFYLKYFDHFLIDKRGAMDAAAVYYFLGRKEDNVLSDRELIKLYRGAQR
jgi:SAM-dependent methyltransferase